MVTKANNFGSLVMNMYKTCMKPIARKKEILWCFLPGKGGPVGKKCSSDTGRADSAYKASNSISQN